MYYYGINGDSGAVVCVAKDAGTGPYTPLAWSITDRIKAWNMMVSYHPEWVD